jgi:hypothetical protein
VAKGSRIRTLSRDDGWFDGHGTADLRAWLRFWEDETRSAGRAEEAASEDPKFKGMTRQDHIAMIKAEISARETARQGRPRAEITSTQRAQLSQLAKRAATTEAKATQARRDLYYGIRQAHAEGASVRVIAEVVGLSPARVQALLHQPLRRMTSDA